MCGISCLGTVRMAMLAPVRTMKLSAPFSVFQFVTLQQKTYSKLQRVQSAAMTQNCRCLTTPVFLSELYFKAARSPLSIFIGEGFCRFHDLTGLRWAAAIVALVVSVRLGMMLPAHITSQKVAAKRNIFFQELDKEVIPKLKATALLKKGQEGWSEKQAKQWFGRAQRLLIKEQIIKRNCAGSKLYLPFLIQIPIWVCTSLSLRNISTMQHATNQQELLLASGRQLELANEGFPWMPNLTIPDPTVILPVLVGVAFLANIELSAARVSKDLITRGGTKPLPKQYYIFNNVFRAIAVLMVPASAGVPSSVALYWAVSGYSGLVVNIIMMSPSFRNFVRIPRLKTDPAQPYRTAFETFKTNWRENMCWFVGVSRKN